MSAVTMSLPSSKPIGRIVRSPKGILIGIFGVLALLATTAMESETVFENLAIAIGVAAALDLAIVLLKRDEWVFPDGAILTGAIVAFLLRPQEPVSTIILSVAVAIASKHLIRTHWSNVLNPAAVALVFSGLFLSAGQSWWGALPDLGLLGAVAVLALGVVIADRINKLPMVLVFLGVYYGLFMIAALTGHGDEVAGIFRSPDIHAALFFALFMLDDPPTSPVKYEDQVVYGIIVATVAYFLLMQYGFVYYLPLALLAGNVWESGRRIVIADARKRTATA